MRPKKVREGRAALLKKLREERKLSLREVEKRTGVSNSLLSQIERGGRSLTLGTARPLAQLYGVPVMDIMTAGTDAAAGDEKPRSRMEFDYEDAYRKIVRKSFQDNPGFTERAFEDVPTPLKQLLVKLEAKATGRKIEDPVITVSIRHSTRNVSPAFSIPERKLKRTILVNARIAAECMEPVRLLHGAVFEVDRANRRASVKVLSDQDFVEAQGLKPTVKDHKSAYYDLADIVEHMATFSEMLGEGDWVFSEPSMPGDWKSRRHRRSR